MAEKGTQSTEEPGDTAILGGERGSYEVRESLCLSGMPSLNGAAANLANEVPALVYISLAYRAEPSCRIIRSLSTCDLRMNGRLPQRLYVAIKRDVG